MCVKFANHPFHIITNQTNIMPPRKRGGIMFFLFYNGVQEVREQLLLLFWSSF